MGDRLRNEGYVVDYAANGDEGFDKATALPFDLILLDVLLPRRNGFAVCRDIREAGLITPILMLTALGQTADKVRGLKIGADDYVTKPFDMQELMARVEALLRRAPSRPLPPGDLTSSGRFVSICAAPRSHATARPVNLSAREFQLLRYFLEHPGKTLSREELLTQVWGYSQQTFTRTVDVHVASLRQKLEDRAAAAEVLSDGSGHRLQVQAVAGPMKLHLKARALPAAVVVTTVGVILLAALQYRWSTEVSEATGVRLADTLQLSMINWHLDFLRNFSEICLTMRVDPEQGAIGDLHQYARRIAEWKAVARYPDLVSPMCT